MECGGGTGPLRGGRSEGDDVGVGSRSGVVGVEVGEAGADVKPVAGEEAAEFVGVIPPEVLGRLVGLLERAVATTDLVVVTADEEADDGLNAVAGVDAGGASSRERGFVVEVPGVLGWVAGEFGVGNEGAEVEAAAGGEVAPDVGKGERRVRENLQGEGGDQGRLVGPAEADSLHVPLVEDGLEVVSGRVLAAELEHVRGAVDALDREALLEEGKEEAAGPAAQVDDRPGVVVKEIPDQREFGGIALGVPERVVERGFEGAVHGAMCDVRPCVFPIASGLDPGRRVLGVGGGSGWRC